MNADRNELDRIDRCILQVLQRDGRIANLKLAESVGLSATALLTRVQRLTREGYILGYEARLDPLKLGRDMLVFDQLLAFREHVGDFGTLLYACHDWLDPALGSAPCS